MVRGSGAAWILRKQPYELRRDDFAFRSARTAITDASDRMEEMRQSARIMKQ
jgi:NADH:ubiquinone oxidoreductase subunit D